MFPIRDENPHHLTPFLTFALIAANVAVWVLVQGMGAPGVLGRSICAYGLIPGEVLGTLSPGVETPLGPEVTCVIGEERPWHTVLTSMFLHGGWFHLIANMWFLWIFGANVEDAMGRLRFAVFYGLCGVAAAAAQVASSPASAVPMVGASGAIGGVMGAYVFLYPRVRVHVLVVLGFIFVVAVPAVFMLGYWFVVQLVAGLATVGAEGGGVAFWAHAGGFAAGLVLVPLFKKAELLERHPYHGWRKRSRTRGWTRVR